MGSIAVALAIVLEDAVLLVAGVVVGAGGIALFIGIGAALVETWHHLL